MADILTHPTGPGSNLRPNISEVLIAANIPEFRNQGVLWFKENENKIKVLSQNPVKGKAPHGQEIFGGAIMYAFWKKI